MEINKNELKYLRSLQQKKYRDEEKKFLLEGWKPLRDALSSRFKIEYICVSEISINRPTPN